MAITINLGTPSVDLTTSVITITDASTYSTPTRAQVGVFVKVYKTDYQGAKSAITTTGNASDPETDVSWTCNFPTDGWFQIAYVAPQDYAGGTTYAKYDAVFDPATNNVYRSKSNGNLGNALNNTTFWELITDPAALAFNIGTATESLNMTAYTGQTVQNIVLFPLTKVEFGTETGLAFLEASSDYKRSEDVRLAELLQLAVTAMTVANDRQEYSLGEIFARRARDLAN